MTSVMLEHSFQENPKSPILFKDQTHNLKCRVVNLSGSATMRFLHKLYARMLGYFWMPCPICGRMFGGHEAGKWPLQKTPSRGVCVCRNPACQRIAEQSFRNFYR